MHRSEQIQDIAKALSEVQGKLNPATKNAQNPHLKNKYADIAAVWDALREILPEHGLSVVQTMVPRDDGRACVRTTLMHTSGQWIEGECALPVPKQDPQGYGSAITYARRYSLSAMVGVVSEEDDDGHAAGKGNGNGNQRRNAQPTPPPTFDEDAALFAIASANTIDELTAVYKKFNSAAVANEKDNVLIDACAKRKKEILAMDSKTDGKISPGQLKAVQAQYTKMGITDREARLKDMSSFQGREIGSFNDLTPEEAHNFLEFMAREKEEHAYAQ